MTTVRKSGAASTAYAWEAAGLAWLADSATIAVAEVVGHDDHSIETVRVEQAAPARGQAERFGRELARLHASGADAFGSGPPGWEGAGWIGAQPLELGEYDSWGAFYAELRVLPYARLAHDQGALPDGDLGVVEQVADGLAAGEFDDLDRPHRIHGDLWSGNVLWGAGGVVAIDPAAHGGHGLDDLAMLGIFGCPHLDVIEDAYAEQAGLEPDWRDRLVLHRLHHLLQHASAFGGSYGSSAAAAARRWLTH